MDAITYLCPFEREMLFWNINFLQILGKFVDYKPRRTAATFVFWGTFFSQNIDFRINATDIE